MNADEGALLTLEPLVDAVREGVEAAGWTLSGMQKTTSHEFGGRWAGESTRSAYLFFHRPDGREPVSVDVFLDETSGGLGGNLTLAVRGPALGELGGFAEALTGLARAAGRSAHARASGADHAARHRAAPARPFRGRPHRVPVQAGDPRRRHQRGGARRAHAEHGHRGVVRGVVGEPGCGRVFAGRRFMRGPWTRRVPAGLRRTTDPAGDRRRARHPHHPAET